MFHRFGRVHRILGIGLLLLLWAQFGFADISPVVAACPASFPVTVPAGDTARLIEVIGCANATASNDVINLTNSIYTLTAVHSIDNGLPTIVSSAAAGTLTINGNGATLARSAAGGVPNFRLFYVSEGANLTLDRLTLTNGVADRGGAMLNSGTVTITNSTVTANYALTGGGAVLNQNAGTITLRNSLVSSNVAGDWGGAFESASGTINLINSTVTGNTANGAGGGAVDNYNGAAVVAINSTIVNNSAPAALATSGFWIESGTLTIQNSIVANNGGTNNCLAASVSVIDNGKNIENGTSCQFGGVFGQNTDPLLGALGNNGGFTQTHALLPGSPAINAGTNNKAVDENGAALTTDQRGAGFARIRLGVVDVGAYEAACPSFPYTVPAGDVTSLITAIECANATPANDVINLASASTYTLMSVHSSGTGLPRIVTTTTAGTLTINGNGATITRSTAEGTPLFRIFSINSGGDLRLNRVTLTNGEPDISEGGAIRNLGMLTVTDSTISDNTANQGGGIYNGTNATLTILRSTISDNYASDGGGIGNFGTARIINSTISGNSANSTGGALFSSTVSIPASMTIINSTITDNEALTNVAESGLFVYNSVVTIQNSIVAGNNGTNNCVIGIGGVINDGGRNIDNGTSCGFGANSLSSTNPLLGALGNNGGFTQTHALQADSPAINAGDNWLAVDHTSAILAFDQRGDGFARIIGGRVDIGAFEAACPSFPYTVPAGQSNQLILAIGCAAVTPGNETINLTAGIVYQLTRLYADATGLPTIATGSGTLTINGNGGAIRRVLAGIIPEFRLFNIESGATLTLNGVTLANGLLTGDNGGAIYNFGGTLNLTDSTLINNRAQGGAGILNAGTTTITRSTVSGNTALVFAGGISSSNTLRLINSTVSGNAANGASGVFSDGGGAMQIGGGTGLIINSTITNNTAADTPRSGIRVVGGTVTIQNSIVAGNNGTNNCVVTGATIIDGGRNIDNGSSCGFGGTFGQDFDPMLAPLANNGGLTQTHALLHGSPAINAGSNANAVDHTGTALTTDQRGAGFPRIVGGTVDIGAYEPTLSSLQVALALQGRSNLPPHASWVITAQVSVMPEGGGAPYFAQDFVTDGNGSLTILNLPTGVYQFRIKGTHTLARVFTIDLVPGGNSTQTNTLFEGDANGNNLINVTDFSLLATAFGKTSGQQGYNPLTDFNQDSIVNVTDFSLLATNFNKTGDGGVSP